MTEVKQIGLQREAWGPRFWVILHTLAEQSGYQHGQILNNDEADAWIILLKAQQNVMPCALCKQHYREWLGSHRVDGLRLRLDDERRNWLREWLYGCHDRVNVLNGKSSPSLQELHMLYPKRSIQPEFNELGTMFQLAIQRNQLTFDDVMRWKHALTRLRKLVGV